jgi:hypothetical protein
MLKIQTRVRRRILADFRTESTTFLKRNGGVGIPVKMMVVLTLITASLSDLMGFEPFEVGKPLPFVLLPSLQDGQSMSIADFRGQKLMLHIWASW